MSDPQGAEGTDAGPGAIRRSLEAGRHVVIQGEAGIGKSHLVTAALRGQPPAGATVVDLPPVPNRHGGHALHALLGMDTVLTDRAAAEALWSWVRAQAGDAPAVLRVESAQLIDDASLQILAQILRRPDICVVATTRADPSLEPLLGELADVDRYTLRPLDTSGVETLLVELLEGFPTADTVHRLWAASRGNPFHLRELVRDQRERGTLVADGDIWVWTGTPVVGRRLLDAVLHDLAGLDGNEREALELAAVVGPVPCDTLAPGVLDRLLRWGLARLAVGPEGSSARPRFETVHPAQADAICAQVGTRRRRELLDSTRDWRVEPPTEDVVRSVSRSVSAHVGVPLPQLLRASRYALRGDDPFSAIELTSAALQRAVADAESVAILTSRADAHLQRDDSAAALRDLAVARTALERLDPSEPTVRTAYVGTVRLEAMVRHFLGGDLGETLRMLDDSAQWLRGAARSGASPARTLRSVHALRLAHLAWGGRHDQMLAAALEMLHRPPDPDDVAPLVGPTIVALALAGRFAEARRLGDTYLPVISSHPSLHRWEPGGFTLTRFLVLVLCGDTNGAERISPAPDALLDLVSVHQCRGVLAAARGQWASARHELRAGNAWLRRRDSLGILASTISWEMVVAAASGDSQGARALMEELAETPRRCSAILGAHIDLQIVDTMIWLGDPGASDLAARLAVEAAGRGHHGIELEALHRLAVVGGVAAARRALEPRHLEDHLSVLGERVDGPRCEALLAHLRAMALRRRRMIDLAAARLPDVGVWLPPRREAARLTRREREIAVLAAGGMTSRAIAQRLTVSVRTVDSHLSSAFTKLGVHSRAGLERTLVRIETATPARP